MSDSGNRFRLHLAGPAERQLAQLPEGVAAAVAEFMVGALLDAPQRVGRPLRNELSGLHAARRGAYRVVYEIDEEAATVRVVRIDHRATVYGRR